MEDAALNVMAAVLVFGSIAMVWSGLNLLRERDARRPPTITAAVAKRRRRAEAYTDRYFKTESPLEEDLLFLIHDSGLPWPETQFWISSGGANYRLDFAYPVSRIAVEADGRQHLLAKQAEYDRVRDERLAEDGWDTLRFTSAEIRQAPQRVIERIRGGVGEFEKTDPPPDPMDEPLPEGATDEWSEPPTRDEKVWIVSFAVASLGAVAGGLYGLNAHATGGLGVAPGDPLGGVIAAGALFGFSAGLIVALGVVVAVSAGEK